MGFYGSVRSINSAKMGPPRKDGSTLIDVLVDTNKDFTRCVVNIPSYNYEQLIDVITGRDWEAWSYIQTMIDKATNGKYYVDKMNPGEIKELISPAGLLSYRLVLNIITNER